MKNIVFSQNDDQVLTPNPLIADWFKPYNPLERDNKPIDFLIEGMVARRQVTIIAGAGGSGKTLLSCFLFLDQKNDIIKVKPSNVLFLTGADCTDEEIIRRSKKVGRNDGFMAVDLPFDMDYRITTEKFYNELVAGVRKFGLNGLIFDSLADFTNGNANDVEIANKIMVQFKRLAIETNSAVVIITHQNKVSRYNKSPKIEDIADSRIFGTKCDYGFAIREHKKNSEGNKVIEIITLKSRSVKEMPPLYVEIVDNGGSLTLKRGTPTPSASHKSDSKSIMAQKVTLARKLKSEGLTHEAIGNIMGVGKSAVTKYLKQ
jgi:KaiC/GvpD/RAD55 family RecA-like ATPase